MATTEITNTPTKRGRGRPRKLRTGGLEVNASLSAAVEEALSKVLSGASISDVVQQPLREIRPDEFNGKLVAALSRKNGRERLVIGRRKTVYRKKSYDFVDARTFYFDAKADKWCPTTKGITFPTAELPVLLKALTEASKAK